MAVILDKSADAKIFETLKYLNIDCYKSCSLDFLYSPVNTHPDMQIHFTDSTTAVVAPSAYNHYASTLPPNINLIKGSSDPHCTYPGDCAYNVAKLGKKIIGNLRYTDPKIKEIYENQGCQFINVNQGYTKCNLCIVDENSVITEDEGLFKTLSANSIDVLKIPSGLVKLNGFANGFLGGASGFISPGKLAFCGNFKNNSIFDQIYSFVKSKLVDIICLSSTEMVDLGSILYFNSNF
ncbi:MAG: hypothetical protein IKW62_03455 [Clostridia bacterium]|nr:hypothetical protein [Clostridia bacterium]